ncbi:cytochrome c oxidase assembly protein [Sphingobium lignivorans]|uniref:Membrane protein n=1 Tax=Sphingobium lignivorans TaxID=2735886 RepID=A0ABR6NCA9_9SPHN|nr:cytochrome c oxidase assembly protein [Sphingobium lignivorans]MBB5984910.1 putative membrane protein [Sphingobium lignivorans]
MDRTWIPYCGVAPLPSDWLTRWNFDPLVIAALLLAGLWAWRRGADRTSASLGLACLALLFLSPLCALSSALFGVRVVHHVLLTAVAAPLLVRGLGLRSPGGAAYWAGAHALLFWIWHAPGPYAFALSSDAAYWLMQASLLGSALGFWAALRGTADSSAIGLLLIMMVQMGLLGALITFATQPMYAPHWLSTQPWGLTPLEDQQVGGLIMWAPASALYLGAALLRGWRMLTPARALPA